MFDLKQVPSSWDEVTVQQYQDILSLPESSDPFELYAILLGLTVDEIRNLDVHAFELALGILENFIDVPVEQCCKPLSEFEFEGVTYKVPDNLEFEKVGLYSDWTDLLSKHNLVDIIPATLAMLCREDGKEYLRKEAAEREKIFHKLPITTAYGVATFFLQKKDEYEKSMLHLWHLMALPTWRQRWSIRGYRLLDYTQRCITWLKDRSGRLREYVMSVRWGKSFISSLTKGHTK